MKKSGVFITLEGNEACGKTTQQKLMAEYLRKKNIEVLLTREPGGTLAGEKIRDILLNYEKEEITPTTEALLLFAARNHHIHNIIKPALAKGIWVISDRFIDSSYAYQGYAGGLEFTTIQQLEKIAVDIQPDICFYFASDWQTSQTRQNSRGANKDRFEKKSQIFFESVENGFKARAEQLNYIKTIDARNNLDRVSQDIFTYLDRLILNFSNTN